MLGTAVAQDGDERLLVSAELLLSGLEEGLQARKHHKEHITQCLTVKIRQLKSQTVKAAQRDRVGNSLRYFPFFSNSAPHYIDENLVDF